MLIFTKKHKLSSKGAHILEAQNLRVSPKNQNKVLGDGKRQRSVKILNQHFCGNAQTLRVLEISAQKKGLTALPHIREETTC